ncbi:hypothetical protein NBRC116594_20680 [Shimia sp. NS0008-38b]
MVMATGQLVCGTALLWIATLVSGTSLPTHLSSPTVYAILGVSVLSTAIPSLLMFWLVRNAGAFNASILAFFIPVSAVILGVGLLQDPLTLATVGGFALVLLGAALSTTRPAKVAVKQET